MNSEPEFEEKLPLSDEELKVELKKKTNEFMEEIDFRTEYTKKRHGILNLFLNILPTLLLWDLYYQRAYGEEPQWVIDQRAQENPLAVLFKPEELELYDQMYEAEYAEVCAKYPPEGWGLWLEGEDDENVKNFLTKLREEEEKKA